MYNVGLLASEVIIKWQACRLLARFAPGVWINWQTLSTQHSILLPVCPCYTICTLLWQRRRETFIATGHLKASIGSWASISSRALGKEHKCHILKIHIHTPYRLISLHRNQSAGWYRQWRQLSNGSLFMSYYNLFTRWQ